MLKKIMLAFMFGLLNFSVHAEVMDIVYDNGGWVDDYVKTVNSMDVGVRFRGKCASSCTMFLASPKGVCIFPTAIFKFHAAFDPVSGDPAKTPYGTRNEKGTKILLSHYSPALKAYLKSKGGLTANWIIINGDEMIKLGYRACAGE